MPLLRRKFVDAVGTRMSGERAKPILDLFADAAKLDATPVDQFMGMWQTK